MNGPRHHGADDLPVRAPARDKPGEECGVVAVHLPRPATSPRLVHLGLFALQHRGQESCGICVASGDEIRIEKDMGLVAEVFTEDRLDRPALRRRPHRHRPHPLLHDRLVAALQRPAAHGPVEQGLLALAHNGNFTNAKAIRDRMLDDGAVFQTTNDSEVMINLVARYAHLSLRTPPRA
jgi:amidophosphoribosyltransferase